MSYAYRLSVFIWIGAGFCLLTNCAPPPGPGPTVTVADDRTAHDAPPLTLEETQAREQLAELKKQLEVNKNDPDIHYQIGIQESRLGNWGEARSKFKKVLDLAPRYAEAQYQIGLTWEHSGEMWVISKGRTVLPVQRERAIEAYKKAIRINPNFADSHYRLAILALMDEDLELARQAIDDLARIEPESDRSHEMLEKLTALYAP